MKFIVIGLGTFGASLAKRLTSLGHEVIGVDNDEAKVNFFKDKISITICLDATDIHALHVLPLKDSDGIIVSIGQDFGASIMITALLKRLNINKIYSRESSSIHKTVLNALGVTETINPEYISADQYAEKVLLPGVIRVMDLTERIKIAELLVPEVFLYKTPQEVKCKEKYNIQLIGIKKKTGTMRQDTPVYEFTPFEAFDITTRFEEGNILLIMGDFKDIQRFMNAT